MSRRAVAHKTEGTVEVRYRPLYARALGLRHLHPGGMLCFAFLEGSIALSLLLALAELVSWWVVLILPVSVALMVKVNDLVAGAVARSAARTPERERERLRREVIAFMPMVGRATVVTQPRPATTHTADTAVFPSQHTDVAESTQEPLDDGPMPADQQASGAGEEHADAAAAGRRDTTGRYAAAGRYLDEAWRQHAYAMAHHTEHADPTSQRERQSASRRYE